MIAWYDEPPNDSSSQIERREETLRLESLDGSRMDGQPRTYTDQGGTRGLYGPGEDRGL